LVVVVGRGRVPGMVPPVIVIVVVVATCRRAVVVVIVVIVVIVRVRVMTCILTWFLVLLDPGRTFLKAMSNREHNLLLSRLLLPY